MYKEKSKCFPFLKQKFAFFSYNPALPRMPWPGSTWPFAAYKLPVAGEFGDALWGGGGNLGPVCCVDGGRRERERREEEGGKKFYISPRCVYPCLEQREHSLKKRKLRLEKHE